MEFKSNKKEKYLGQVFTPIFIVKKIIKLLNINNKKIIGLKILDPACGDGRFLIQLAKLIIKYSRKEDLEKNLYNIYGWDIDPVSVKDCINNLNCLLIEHGLNLKITWNVFTKNSLHEIACLNPTFFNLAKVEKFDVILGNPPYIRIQNLEIKERTFIQKNFNFCSSGSTDIFIAFFELAIKLLTKNGKCGFITPNSYLKSETAKKLRKYFELNKNINSLINFKSIQVFESVSTYCAITIFSSKRRKFFNYYVAESKSQFIYKKIMFSKIENSEFWHLSLNNTEDVSKIKLKDICKISVGLATLCDKAYVVKIIKEIDKNFVLVTNKLVDSFLIERELLKPVVKGSKIKNSNEKITEYIIFPYRNEFGKNKIIPESEMKLKYLNTYKYFLSIKEILLKRSFDKVTNEVWYAYGRSQALDTSFGSKIIFSPMNKIPNFVYYSNSECTLYSGYFIKYDKNYNNLLTILNSEELKNFINDASSDFRDGWKSYNKKILEHFDIPSKFLSLISQEYK